MTYLGEKHKDFKVVKNAEIFQGGEKYRDFSKVVKNAKIFQRGEKYRDFSKVVKNAEIFQSGLVVMGDLPGLKMKRVFKVGKNIEIF